MGYQECMVTMVVAAVRGEVRADTAAAFGAAGMAVHDELSRIEDARAGLAVDGIDAWSIPLALAAQGLCTWNAFVLHTLGERLISGYETSPRSAGFLPLVTAEQVSRLLGQVDGWLGRARLAGVDPGYFIDDEVAVPADLPDWVEAKPCPPAHLVAMLAAGVAVQEHAQLALDDLERAGIPEWCAAQMGTLRQLSAQAQVLFEVAGRLYAPGTSPMMPDAAKVMLQRALEAFYHLGQLVAMPALIERYRIDTRLAAAGARRPSPGERYLDS